MDHDGVNMLIYYEAEEGVIESERVLMKISVCGSHCMVIINHAHSVVSNEQQRVIRELLHYG